MLSLRERDFLERLHRKQPLAPADRPEDRARQKMRRLGYATVLYKPRRWAITDAGIAALGGTDAA